MKKIFMIIVVVFLGVLIFWGAFSYVQLATFQISVDSEKYHETIYRWDLPEDLYFLEKLPRLQSSLQSKDSLRLVEYLIERSIQYVSMFEMEVDMPEEQFMSEEIERVKKIIENYEWGYERGRISQEAYEYGIKKEKEKLESLEKGEKQENIAQEMKRWQMIKVSLSNEERHKLLRAHYETETAEEAIIKMLKEKIEAGNIVIHNRTMKKEIYELVGLQE